jgi:hypothetical protein
VQVEPDGDARRCHPSKSLQLRCSIPDDTLLLSLDSSSPPMLMTGKCGTLRKISEETTWVEGTVTCEVSRSTSNV